MGAPPPADDIPPDSYTVTLLDTFEMTIHGEPVQLAVAGQRLVALLALEPRPRSRERVAATLWPDAPTERAAANVRRALFGVLRSAPGAIVATGHLLALGSHVRVDVQELQLMPARTDGELVLPRDVRVLEVDLLPDWPDPWLDGARESVHDVRLRRLEDWAHDLLSAGQGRQALDAARAAARLDPLRESTQRLVVQSHLADGNRAAAVRQFRAYESDLWRDLRVRPGEELRALVGVDPPGAARRPGRRDSVRV